MKSIRDTFRVDYQHDPGHLRRIVFRYHDDVTTRVAEAGRGTYLLAMPQDVAGQLLLSVMDFDRCKTIGLYKQPCGDLILEWCVSCEE